MYTTAEIASALTSRGICPPSFPYGQELTNSALEQLRTQPDLQPWLQEMRSIAQRAASAEIPIIHFQRLVCFEKTGSRREYEEVYRERRLRLQALTAVSLLDQTGEYIPALEDLLWETCNEYTWCMNASWPIWRKPENVPEVPLDQYIELGASMLAYWLAETVYLLRGRLHPLVEERVRNEVNRRVIDSWLNTPGRYPWESCRMNWASVCSGGIGMAALLLSDPGNPTDMQRLTAVINRVLPAMDSYLEGFGEDGGCAEGIGYWQYGLSYYAGFAGMLYEYSVGGLNLLEGSKIRAIAEFPLRCALSPEHFANYSDAPSKAQLHPGLLALLHRHTGQRLPELQHFPRSFMPMNLAGALWFDPIVMRRTAPQGTSVLPDLQWVVAWRGEEGRHLGFSAKGGHNAEPHNHNDLGHFIIQADGESLLADLGSPVYSKDYFSSRRYEHLHASSLGHSVPVINGAFQKEGREHEARILDAHPMPDGVRFALELGRAYEAPGLLGFIRIFDWSAAPGAGEGCLLLTDEFSFTEDGAVIEESFVSLLKPVLSPGKAVWTGERSCAVLEYPAERLQPSVEARRTDSPEGAGTMYRLLLTLHGCGKRECLLLRFAIKLL
ncbi:MAG: hypothetical protein K0R57_2645 [Paenibacillaceae bacterium]|jgi:hypothetical protein|nr:hypothetical protein [Paenibacillaceae bacterium]